MRLRELLKQINCIVWGHQPHPRIKPQNSFITTEEEYPLKRYKKGYYFDIREIYVDQEVCRGCNVLYLRNWTDQEKVMAVMEKEVK